MANGGITFNIYEKLKKNIKQKRYFQNRFYGFNQNDNKKKI